MQIAPRRLALRASARAHNGEEKAPSGVPAAVSAAQGPLSRRQLALGLGAAVGAWTLALRERDSAAWALLEADDDDDLLERVKRDRKERRVKEEALRPEGGEQAARSLEPQCAMRVGLADMLNGQSTLPVLAD